VPMLPLALRGFRDDRTGALASLVFGRLSVLAGTVIHRGTLLSAAERAEGVIMLACVWRGKGPLTLKPRTLGEPFPRSLPDGEGGSGHLKAIRFVGAHRPTEILDVPGPRPMPRRGGSRGRGRGSLPALGHRSKHEGYLTLSC
jgi:hypothetical protein